MVWGRSCWVSFVENTTVFLPRSPHTPSKWVSSSDQGIGPNWDVGLWPSFTDFLLGLEVHSPWRPGYQEHSYFWRPYMSLGRMGEEEEEC